VIDEQLGEHCFVKAINVVQRKEVTDKVLQTFAQTGIDLVANEENYDAAFPNGEETKEVFQRVLCVIGSEKEIKRLKEKEEQMKRDQDMENEEKEDEKERAEEEEKEKEQRMEDEKQAVIHRAFKESDLSDAVIDELYKRHIRRDSNGQQSASEKFIILYLNLGPNVNVSAFLSSMNSYLQLFLYFFCGLF